MKQHPIALSRILTRFLLGFVVIAIFLFLPAGTWGWPEAWIFLAIFFAWTVGITIYLYRYSPELLERRLTIKIPPKSWDKIFMLLMYIFFFTQFILLGLDAVRFSWSHARIWIEIIGFIGLSFSFYVFFLVMKENPFLARIVEIVPDQQVVTTGPYAIIRHPMYLGAIIMLLSLSLALGSFYSLIPAFCNVVNVIIRTQLEDTALQQELRGYKEYVKKTSYKLLPGIW